MRPVYVRYRDHVLFRNANPSLFQPSIREAYGWLAKEDEEAIWLCLDKPVENLPHEKLDPATGLVILKDDILEMKEIA